MSKFFNGRLKEKVKEKVEGALSGMKQQSPTKDGENKEKEEKRKKS